MQKKNNNNKQHTVQTDRDVSTHLFHAFFGQGWMCVRVCVCGGGGGGRDVRMMEGSLFGHQISYLRKEGL